MRILKTISELKGIIVAAKKEAKNKPMYPHSAKNSIIKFNLVKNIIINSIIIFNKNFKNEQSLIL